MRTLDPPRFYCRRRHFRAFELLLSCDFNWFPVSPSAFLICHICGRANSTWTYYSVAHTKKDVHHPPKHSPEACWCLRLSSHSSWAVRMLSLVTKLTNKHTHKVISLNSWYISLDFQTSIIFIFTKLDDWLSDYDAQPMYTHVHWNTYKHTY